MNGIKIPLYGGKLIVDVSASMKDAFEKHGIVASSYAYDGITVSRIVKGKKQYMVILKPSPSPGIIAHEAKHVVNYIFKNAGVSLDVDNDEPECYLLGWIVNRIHEIVSKHERETRRNCPHQHA